MYLNQAIERRKQAQSVEWHVKRRAAVIERMSAKDREIVFKAIQNVDPQILILALDAESKKHWDYASVSQLQAFARASGLMSRTELARSSKYVLQMFMKKHTVDHGRTYTQTLKAWK